MSSSITVAARAAGGTSRSTPPKPPTAVLSGSQITASRTVARGCHKKTRGINARAGPRSGKHGATGGRDTSPPVAPYPDDQWPSTSPFGSGASRLDCSRCTSTQARVAALAGALQHGRGWSRLSALGVSAGWDWAGEAALDELAYALVQGRRHRLLALGGDRAGGAGGGEHFLLGGHDRVDEPAFGLAAGRARDRRQGAARFELALQLHRAHSEVAGRRTEARRAARALGRLLCPVAVRAAAEAPPSSRMTAAPANNFFKRRSMPETLPISSKDADGVR